MVENIVFIQADTIVSRRECYEDGKVRFIPSGRNRTETMSVSWGLPV